VLIEGAPLSPFHFITLSPDIFVAANHGPNSGSLTMRLRSKRYKKDIEKIPPKPVALDEAVKRLKTFFCLPHNSHFAHAPEKGTETGPYQIMILCN